LIAIEPPHPALSPKLGERGWVRGNLGGRLTISWQKEIEELKKDHLGPKKRGMCC